MRKSNIDNSRRKVQEKLGNDLAGPFEKYIPQSWVQDILQDIGFRFRQAVFSPLGDDMGVHRPSSGGGSIVQSGFGAYSIPSFTVGPAACFNGHRRLL